MGRLLMIVCLSPFSHPITRLTAQEITEISIKQELVSHASPLRSSGRAILLKEADQHKYLLLGELHGENEIPELLSDLWPSLWSVGYRHVAGEVSPWAAMHLQRTTAVDGTPVPGLWTRAQTANVLRFAMPGQTVLWGCDIEEMQPDRLIRLMAQLNPRDARLKDLLEIVSSGYSRRQAPELFRLAKLDHPAHDILIGNVSLWKNTLDTLRVEALRSDSHTRYLASEAREHVMKDLFLSHLNQEPGGKVLLRFGRNHLHRGLDARGISTLGNFVSEWALAHGQSVVNIGVFAAGGKGHLAGQTFDADERQDEPTFALLAALAGNDATLFDLRDLRPILHAIPLGKRTPLETNLIYWTDSYDLLLCYPSVSPLKDLSAEPR